MRRVFAGFRLAKMPVVIDEAVMRCQRCPEADGAAEDKSSRVTVHDCLLKGATLLQTAAGGVIPVIIS